MDLRDAVRTVLSEHPTLRARQMDVNAAQSGLESAHWQYWPTPTVSLLEPDRALTPGADRVVRMLSLKQPLWTGGRLQAGLSYASAQKRTAEAVREEARRDVLLELIQAWSEACSALGRLAVYQKSLKAHQLFVEQIQRRTRAGLSVNSDIALARSRLESVLVDVSNAQLALNVSLDRLRTLTGRSEFSLKHADGLLPSHVGLLEQALQADPSLMRMRSEIQELQAQIDSQKSAFWPDLHLSMTQRHGDVTGRVHQIAIGLESKWGAGLSHASALQVLLKRLEAKEADAHYRTSKLSEQIHSEKRTLETARIKASSFQRAVEEARAVAESWDRQFVAGKKSWQDVMNAVRESTQLEVQWVDIQGAAAAIDLRLSVLAFGVDWVQQHLPKKP